MIRTELFYHHFVNRVWGVEMKKIGSFLLILVLVLCLCAAAAPGSYLVTGTDMVLKFPSDYVVFGQNGPMSGNEAAAGLTKADIDETVALMKQTATSLYATQIDQYDTIYIDSDSFAESRGMQDFTKFCKTNNEMSDKELLAKLEEATYLRGPNIAVEDYSSESMEIVTINGEKYGYAVGVFSDETGEQYVLEYNTVKNGKAIRLEMYISSGAPHDDQVEAFRRIVQSIGYQRGADSFLSQYIFGTNGAALIPWIVLGICVIAAAIVLAVLLRIRRKKHPKPAKQQEEVSQPQWQNQSGQVQNPYQEPQPQAQPQIWQQEVQPQSPVQQPVTQPTMLSSIYGQASAPVTPAEPQQMQQTGTNWEPEPPGAALGSVTASQQTAIPPQAPVQQPVSPQEPIGQTDTDVVKMLESLAELKRQGILTPEEYEMKKSELLRRL